MAPLRTIKTRGWASLISLILISVYLVSSWDATYHSKLFEQQNQHQEKPVAKPINKGGVGHVFDRLKPAHKQLLSSALAHIRLGYVANKTPDISTPPLLVLYSCKEQDGNNCGTLDSRLINIVNAYYFSMLQQGSAFAYDMTFPVRMEWFFESSPSYMSMNVDQANFYLERAQPHQIKREALLSSTQLRQRRFMEDYQREGTTIVSHHDWKEGGGSWMDLRENPSMKALRDKYRLNHLPQKSDWFWLASQLLFARPSYRLREHLEPYRELMGGRLEPSESLSPLDPDNARVTSDVATKGWLRIGLRVSKESTEQEAICLCAHVANVCRRNADSINACHVFLSAPSRTMFNTLRAELNRSGHMAVHAVAEGYRFTELNEEPEDDDDHSVLDSEEDRLLRDYARTFMDWIILSRMDYLVGEDRDGFLKTAAWAAQVQTDVAIHNKTITEEGHCQIVPMSDW